MKVSSVTQKNFVSSNIATQYPFLYTPNPAYKPSHFKEHRREYLGGLASLILASICLTKFMGKKTLPKSVVEIANENIGLNKIKNAGRTINQLKNDILYPIKAVQNGERKRLIRNFKSGLIIIDSQKSKQAKNILDALTEHAVHINIHCISVEKPTIKKDLGKSIHKAIDDAIKYNKETSDCVLLNLGDLNIFSQMNPSNIQAKTTVEKRLRELPPGIIWTSWTNKGEALPYFHNNGSVLMTKIID